MKTRITIKKMLSAFAAFCLLSSLPVCGQVVDSLVVKDIISQSSTIIQGTAEVRSNTADFAPNCVCLYANRINDRLVISGSVPPCDLETSKVHYTICDSIIVADIVLAPDKQGGESLVTMDFGPCTADSYTLYVRYNGTSPISFGVGYLDADAQSDGYTTFPLGAAPASGTLSVLTAEPKAGAPLELLLEMDCYKGIDNLTISSAKVNGSDISVCGSCCYGAGSDTHAATTITVENVPYPGTYVVGVSLSDAEGKGHTAVVPSIAFKATADEGWEDPRTMADFLSDIRFQSGVKEDESFLLQAKWDKLVLPDNTSSQAPAMQVDSVVGSKVFVSVHYDTSVDVPYDFTCSWSKVTIPALRGGEHTVVFTGVDGAGRYDYAPCEKSFFVDYARHTGKIVVGGVDSQSADEEGTNDLVITFVGDSLHVQGLLWMQCNYEKSVSYTINGETITLLAVTHNTRDHAAARFPVDFYLTPCPLDQYTVTVTGTGKTGSIRDTLYITRQNAGDPTLSASPAQPDIVSNRTYDIYYDLLGRPVALPTRGIYIQNGRKVWVE